VNDSRLRTGWVCIATEGNSIDGRYITRQWLQDMAESYDPEFYCALIWPDHSRWTNMGSVEDLKVEDVDGKAKLFAILRPTRDLIYYNQNGQYQFCSIEPFEKFAGGDKTYLLGLGITDTPASTGTTRLQFSAKHDHSRIIGQSEPLDLSGISPAQAEGLFKKLAQFLARHGDDSTPPPTPEEEPAMDKEQFAELKTMITGIADKQTALETQFAAIKPVPAADPEPAKTDPAPAATGITAEQFAELLTTVKGVAAKQDALASKQGELETQFNSLLEEQPGQRPAPAPAGPVLHLV